VNRVEVDPGASGSAEAADIATRAQAFAQRALDRIGAADWDLSIALTDDPGIRLLNRDYRGKDEPTDVLSFGQGEWFEDGEAGRRYLAGDIVISLDSLMANSEYFGVDPDLELSRLVLHGILHLNGMDHEDNDPGRPMLALQEKILEELTKEGRV
jgi:probable rRNA maturation factor